MLQRDVQTTIENLKDEFGNSFTVPNLGTEPDPNLDKIPPMENIGVTFNDLLKGGGLSLNLHGKNVASLASRVATLPAGPIIGLILSLTGVQKFDKKDIKDLENYASLWGIDLGITDSNGTPRVLITPDRGSYLIGTSSNGISTWYNLDLNPSTPLNAAPADEMSKIVEKAANIEAVAGGANMTIPGVKGLKTSEVPFRTSPKFIDLPDGQISIEPRILFSGIKVPNLMGTSLTLVASGDLPMNNLYWAYETNAIYGSINQNEDAGWYNAGNNGGAMPLPDNMEINLNNGRTIGEGDVGGKKGEGNYSGHGSDQGGFGQAIGNSGFDGSLGAISGNVINHDGARDYTYDPDELSILDTINAGSFENASHKKIRDQLVKNVLKLSIIPIVNVIKTLNNERELNQNDWHPVAAACNNGGFDLGVVTQDGQLGAMFTASGDALAKGTNANGTQGWARLNNPSIIDESSRLAQVRLESLNKVADTPISNPLRIFGPGSPYRELPFPDVSQSGDIIVKGTTLYTGAKVQLHSLPIGLVFAKRLG